VDNKEKEKSCKRKNVYQCLELVGLNNVRYKDSDKGDMRRIFTIVGKVKESNTVVKVNESTL